MTQPDKDQDRIKCPFCAELILPDAKLCRFCHSDLVNRKPAVNFTDRKAEKVSIIKAMLWNLFCPGLAAWKLGYKVRGLIVMGLVMGCMLIYAHQVTPVINKSIQKLIKTGNTRKLDKLNEELENNPWLDWSMYFYIYSFVDVFLVMRKVDSGKDRDAKPEN
ncbi:MAG: hypothetical protein Kow0029_28710 [Candidatus Rifleibacteriota bacterium]